MSIDSIQLSIQNLSLDTCPIPKIKIFSAEDNRFVCESENCKKLPNKIAQTIEETFRDIHQFFSSQFKLCGIFKDAVELPPVYIDLKKINAWWSPGEVKWKVNNKYASMKEVLLHEYTHAINHNRLADGGQSGALDEHLSDVFAIVYKHSKDRNYDNWWIGDIRDISSGEYGHMNKFQGPEFSREPHDYSGVPSYAFYLALKFTEWPTPYAESKMSQIWFKAMQNLDYHETFESFANKTIVAAERQMQRYVKSKSEGQELKSVAKKKLVIMAGKVQELINQKQAFQADKESLESDVAAANGRVAYRNMKIQAARTEIESPRTTPEAVKNAERRIKYHTANISATDRRTVATAAIALAQFDRRIARCDLIISASRNEFVKVQQEIKKLNEAIAKSAGKIETYQKVSLSLKKAWTEVGVL